MNYKFPVEMDVVEVRYVGHEFKTPTCLGWFQITDKDRYDVDRFAKMLLDYRWRTDAQAEAKSQQQTCRKYFTKNKHILEKPAVCHHCQLPSKRPLHAHHEDYSKPLDVVWLCSACHRFFHRGRKMEDFHPNIIFQRPADKIPERYLSYSRCKLSGNGD